MAEKNYGCDHIGIFTNNPGKLVKFYTDKLGFTKEKEDMLSRSIMESIFGVLADCSLIRLGLGNVKIEIFAPVSVMENKIDNIFGYNHWGFVVPDRNKFLDELKNSGVDIIEVKRDGRSVYFIKDPDGNRIEIRE